MRRTLRFEETEPPGDPPRSVGYGALFSLLPGNLQIMVFAYPLVALAGGICFTLRPDGYSGKVLLAAVYVLPIYVVMIERFRRKLQHYQQVAGSVTAVTSGDVSAEFGGCKVVRYRYEFDGSAFDDEHLTADAKGLRAGDSVWVLVDPNDPSRSVIWVGT